MGVHVGPGVLHLAGLHEDRGHDGVELADQLEHLVLGQVLEGELALAGVARVGLPEDGVAVAGHDLAGLEQAPDVVLQLVVGRVEANVLDNLQDEMVWLMFDPWKVDGLVKVW